MLAGGVVLSACEQQEAKPLGLSVPAAIALVGIGVVVTWWAWKTLNHLEQVRKREPRRRPPTAFDYVLAAVTFVPVAAAALVTLALLSEVAYKYRTPRDDLFSWGDTVELAILAETITVVGGLLLARLPGRSSGDTSGRASWPPSSSRSRRSPKS